MAMSWIDELTFDDPLWDLRDYPRRFVYAQELADELAPDHELFGCTVEVLAKSTANDDLIVRCADRLAVVHLTWSGKTEPSPWPSTTYIDSPAQLREYLGW